MNFLFCFSGAVAFAFGCDIYDVIMTEKGRCCCGGKRLSGGV